MAMGYYEVYKQIQSKFNQEKEEFGVRKSAGTAVADEIALFSKLTNEADET